MGEAQSIFTGEYSDGDYVNWTEWRRSDEGKHCELGMAKALIRCAALSKRWGGEGAEGADYADEEDEDEDACVDGDIFAKAYPVAYDDNEDDTKVGIADVRLNTTFEIGEELEDEGSGAGSGSGEEGEEEEEEGEEGEEEEEEGEEGEEEVDEELKEALAAWQ